MTISRRQFIASTGSALFGAAILSQYAWHREIDLMPFCDSDVSRYDLSKPFAQLGSLIATDGRILVRTGETNCELSDETARLPDCSNLPLGTDGRWQKWPTESLITYDDGALGVCPYCEGRGRTGNVKECGRCDGFGCGHCKHTGYVGGVKCDYCDGQGETDKPTLQPVGSLAVGGNYDRKIRQLGSVSYRIIGIPDVAKSGKKSSGVAFRFDGGEGLLMPVMRG